MNVGDITYVRSGDGEVAYQVMGDGPIDLLIIGYIFAMESHLDEPRLARFLEGLASFSRVIRFDRRGVGLSDPFSLDAPPTLEQGAQDALVVLDAVGSEKAAVMTDAGASHVAVLLAASHPSRVSDLVLVHPYARGRRDDDYRWGYDDAQAAQAIEAAAESIRRAERTSWGPGALADAAFMEWSAKWARRATSPSTASALMEVTLDSDVRPLLSTLRTRTLVITRREARTGQRGMSEDFAERLPDSTLVDVEGDSPLPWTPPFGEMLDAIQEFLTGTKPIVTDDRVFATVLFTDIVSSTPKTAALGDAKWREVLDAHDNAVRVEVERFRGRLVKSTGDGVLVTFDGPARAVRCAQAIGDAVRAIGIEVRAGLHAGEVELRGEDLTGMAVNIARRVCDIASAGEVAVSRTIADLVVGSGLEFEDRGEHELKGVPGRWQLYAVKS